MFVSPARTQPNMVSNAGGEPGTPVRRPWHIICVKTSIPRRRSIWPGTSKSGSASVRSDHSGLKGIGYKGKSYVTQGMMTPVTSNYIVCSCVGETTNLVSMRVGDSWERPPISMILAPWLRQGRRKNCVKRSDTNESEDPGSRSARDTTEDPSEARISARHVMRRECDDKPGVVTLAETLVTGVGVGAAGWVFCSLRSTCSRVWCGFWYLLQWCRDLHCLTKCPGHKA